VKKRRRKGIRIEGRDSKQKEEEEKEKVLE
jgi:hypothetical protein